LEGILSSLTYTISSIYHSNNAFLNSGLKASLYLFLKVGIKKILLISPILSKLYGCILERKIIIWIESHEKGVKG